MNITYNNNTPEDYGWLLATRPVITPSEVEQDRYKIPGRVGELLGTYQTRGNAKVAFTLHCKAAVIINGKIVTLWLREPGHNLILSDESAYCMEVLATDVKSYNNIDDEYKRVEVEMEVYPYKYKRLSSPDGTVIGYGSTKTITFDGTDMCEPLYRIEATGSGTLTVNDNVMQVSSGDYYIDVRRKLAYTNATPSQPADDKIAGSYEDLVLHDGSNTITTSANVKAHLVKTREGYII